MYAPWMYDPWLFRLSPLQLKKYLQCKQVAVHRLLWHCMFDPWALFNYPIIPEGLGMIAESSGLRGRPEGAQRLKAGPEGPMIPRVMPSPEGMIRVHSDPHCNKEENKSAKGWVEQNSCKALQKVGRQQQQKKKKREHQVLFDDGVKRKVFLRKGALRLRPGWTAMRPSDHAFMTVALTLRSRLSMVVVSCSFSANLTMVLRVSREFFIRSAVLNLSLTIRWVPACCSDLKVRWKRSWPTGSSRLLFLRTTWTTLFDSGMYMYDRQTSSEPERCFVFQFSVFEVDSCMRRVKTVDLFRRHGPEIYWGVRIPRSGRHDKARWQDCPSCSDAEWLRHELEKIS